MGCHLFFGVAASVKGIWGTVQGILTGQLTLKLIVILESGAEYGAKNFLHRFTSTTRSSSGSHRTLKLVLIDELALKCSGTPDRAIQGHLAATLVLALSQAVWSLRSTFDIERLSMSN